MLPSDDIPGRLARLEARLEAHDSRISREVEYAGAARVQLGVAIERLTTIVEHQEDRVDRIELTIARGIGILAVLVLLANIIGPFIVQYISNGRL